MNRCRTPTFIPGDDMVRAVALGYDIGARLIISLGAGGAQPAAQPVLPDHDLRRHRRRRRDAAPRSAPGAPCVLLCGTAGFRHRLLGARPRAYREGVRFRRHGRAQRRHGGNHGRIGVHGGRGSLQRQPECVHRAGRKPLADSSSPSSAPASTSSAPRSRNGASARRCSRCSIPSRCCWKTAPCAPAASRASPSTFRPRASASSTTARSPISACSTSSRS